jgi:hypothetical protein
MSRDPGPFRAPNNPLDAIGNDLAPARCGDMLCHGPRATTGPRDTPCRQSTNHGDMLSRGDIQCRQEAANNNLTPLVSVRPAPQAKQGSSRAPAAAGHNNPMTSDGYIASSHQPLRACDIRCRSGDFQFRVRDSPCHTGDRRCGGADCPEDQHRGPVPAPMDHGKAPNAPWGNDGPPHIEPDDPAAVPLRHSPAAVGRPPIIGLEPWRR